MKVKLCYFDEDELMNMFDELMKNEIVLFDELMNFMKNSSKSMNFEEFLKVLPFTIC